MMKREEKTLSNINLNNNSLTTEYISAVYDIKLAKGSDN